MYLPKVILDTSAINALEDQGADSAPLMRRLAWEFDVLLGFTNLEELISTPSERERIALVARFERLRRPGKCIVPPNEIVCLMISSHARAPREFVWKNVDVFLSAALEQRLAQRDYLHDEFCERQKVQNRGIEKRFRGVLESPRPALDEIPPQERPGSFAELVASDAVDGRFAWNYVRGLYGRVSGKELTEPGTNEFVAACPPLRALALGQLMGFYSWSLRGHRGRKAAAGRNDLSMTAYLPYCDCFITNDCSQRQALSEVTREAEIACRVLSLAEFQCAVAG